MTHIPNTLFDRRRVAPITFEPALKNWIFFRGLVRPFFQLNLRQQWTQLFHCNSPDLTRRQRVFGELEVRRTDELN